MASPGSRIWDISYLAYRLVPFAEDSFTYDGEAFGSRSVRLQMLLEAYGIDFDRHELLRAMSDRLDVLASYSDVQSQISARSELAEHALMYRRDAQKIRALGDSTH